jgi:hypothetical protein
VTYWDTWWESQHEKGLSHLHEHWQLFSSDFPLKVSRRPAFFDIPFRNANKAKSVCTSTRERLPQLDLGAHLSLNYNLLV